MVNKVVLIGRLGGDVVLKYTQSGQSVANFSLATSKRWTDKQGQRQEKTEWHRIVVWGKLAEICKQFLNKGSMAYVEGELQTHKYESKEHGTRYTTNVVADHVRFLDGKKTDSGESGEQPIEEFDAGMFG